MKPLQGILWGFALLAAAGGGYVGGVRHAARTQRTVAATINGESVSNSELDSALRLKGAEVLRNLLEQKAILQEARKLSLNVDESQFQPPMEIKDAGRRQAIVQEAKALQLLKKILLKDVTEKQKRQVYDLFKDELTEFDINCIALSNSSEATFVERSLKEGSSFEQLAAQHTNEFTRKTDGKLGFLPLSVISQNFGDKVADAVVVLKPGASTPAISSPHGLLMLQVVQRHQSYEDLVPAIEDLIAQSRRLSLMQRLMSEAKISSPYITDVVRSVPTPIASP